MDRASTPPHGTLQIGVFADSLHLPLREGMRATVAMGASSFQLFTTQSDYFSGELLPAHTSLAEREQFRKYYTDLGLSLSATCVDLGHGFADEARNPELVSRMREQIDFAADLGASIITTHFGTVPAAPDAVWDTLRKALDTIGAYAEGQGVVLAAETGLESGPVLRAFLDSLQTGAIRVNFDPANLLVSGFNLDEALDALLPYIVHTHAKDGSIGGYEMPIGDGDVPWPQYIARLQHAGYHGAFTIEREVDIDIVGDIKRAIAFLQQF